MPRKLLYVTVDSVTLHTLGEPPNAHDPSVKYALLASLQYPRSGAPNVTSALTIRNLNKGSNPLPGDSFFSNGVFKEEVQDSTILTLKLVSRQETGKIEHFLLELFSTAAGAGLGLLTGGLGSVLGAISGFGIDKLRGQIQESDHDEVVVIGETQNILIEIAQIGPEPELRTYLLYVKEEITKRYIDPATKQPATLRISPGANGNIGLRIWAENL